MALAPRIVPDTDGAPVGVAGDPKFTLDDMLLEITEHRDDTSVFAFRFPREVKGKRVFLELVVHGLGAPDVAACEDEAALTDVRNGKAVRTGIDEALLKKLVVVKGTLEAAIVVPPEGEGGEEVRKPQEVWRSRALQERHGVHRPADLVDKVLFGGEVDRVFSKIEDLSGYGIIDVDARLKEAAKN